MKLHTNDLWILQELDYSYIQLGERCRRVKLTLSYDYASQFILDAEIYFLREAKVTGMELYRKIHKYGIPNTILLVNQEYSNRLADKMKNPLGIQIISDDVFKMAGGEKFNEQLSALEEFCRCKRKVEQHFRCIGERKYRNYKELYKAVRQQAVRWNYRVGMTVSPFAHYQNSRNDHIYIDEQVLGQCYLYKCEDTVSSQNTLKILQKRYQTPRYTSGKTITFYVSLIQRNEIYIYDEEKKEIQYCCPLI